MMESLNSWGAFWFAWFAPMVLQNTIFLALILVALHLLRRAPVGVRAAVATVGVLKLAVPPFVPLAWLRGPVPSQFEAAAGGLLFSSEAETLRTATGTDTVVGSGISLSAVLMGAWGIVAGVLLIRALVHTAHLGSVLRRAKAVATRELPSDLAAAEIAIRRCDDIAVPLTSGMFPRVIFVPSAWSTWPAAARSAVLRHELAHIRRRDALVQAVEIVVGAVYFFHPLVFVLVRRLRVWREMACDDASVGTDAGARLLYSRFLLQLAETALNSRPTTESASALARRRSDLFHRITHQVKESPMQNFVRGKRILILAVLCVAALPLSLVFGQAPPPPPPPPEKAARATEVEVATPAAAAQKPGKVPPPPPRGAIKLELSTGDLRVNGEPVPLKKLDQALAAVVAINSNLAPVVVIDSDGGVTMGRLGEVETILRKRGLNRVMYAGEMKDKVPLVLPPDKAREKLAGLPEALVLPVRIDDSGQVSADGRDLDPGKLASLVAQRLADEPKLVVSLASSHLTPFAAFVKTLQALKDGGATRIAVETSAR